MSDRIDRTEAQERIGRLRTRHQSTGVRSDFSAGVDAGLTLAAIELTKMTPVEDCSIEIVHCGECKYREALAAQGFFICQCSTKVKREDGFCDLGVKGESENA